MNENKSKIKPINTLIVYNFFPHYRIGVINALQRYSGFHFLGSSLQSEDGIIPLNKNHFNYFSEIGYKKLFGLYFQFSLIPRALFDKYDTIIFLANPRFISTWVAAIIGRARGKRIIFWGHGFIKKSNYFEEFIRKIFFRLAHAFLCYGYFAKTRAVTFGFNPKSIHVVFNSLKQPEVNICDVVNPPVTDGVFRIAAVSRLTARCRYNQLIEAVSVLCRKFSLPIELIFIGDGPEDKILRNLAITKDVRATFLGAIYDENSLWKILGPVDAIASPGKVGLTSMLAMQFGIPVITHNDVDSQMPEFEAVIEGFTGTLHTPNDIDSIASAIFRLYKYKMAGIDFKTNCMRVIHEVYNPNRQAEIIVRAVRGLEAEEGDDMLRMFSS